ncbi:MAG: hypothetical protein ABJA75_24725 [Bradyrhizobium sp.]
MGFPQFECLRERQVLFVEGLFVEGLLVEVLFVVGGGMVSKGWLESKGRMC